MKIKRIITTLALICAWIYINNLYRDFKEQKKNDNKREKLIKDFDLKTVIYLENFNCYETEYIEKEFQIKKFITVNAFCEPEMNVNVYDDLKPYFNKNIDSVTTIIKVFSEPGKIENITYQRLKNRITFIDKESKTVFKVLYVDFKGEIPKSKGSFHLEEGKKVLFGQKPSNDTKNSILNFIKSTETSR